MGRSSTLAGEGVGAQVGLLWQVLALIGPLPCSFYLTSSYLLTCSFLAFKISYMLLVSLLLLRFSFFFYFSGFGIFQVKYDGQLRTEEDAHSLSCDVHCLRVQKSNSGANKFMKWTDGGYHGGRCFMVVEIINRNKIKPSPRSLAGGRVGCQRRSFWSRWGGLSPKSNCFFLCL